MEILIILSLIAVVFVLIFLVYKFRKNKKVDPFVLTKKEKKEIEEYFNNNWKGY